MVPHSSDDGRRAVEGGAEGQAQGRVQDRAVGRQSEWPLFFNSGSHPSADLASSDLPLPQLEAKEGGTPVLRALSSSSLTLTANTTSLLPWDTKLGFHPRPFIACLASLSADGGLVPVMDIVVEKCFPLAYVDGYDQPPPGLGGQPSTQQQQPVMRGPQISRSEADEAKEVVKWEVSLPSSVWFGDGV